MPAVPYVYLSPRACHKPTCCYSQSTCRDCPFYKPLWTTHWCQWWPTTPKLCVTLCCEGSHTLQSISYSSHTSSSTLPGSVPELQSDAWLHAATSSFWGSHFFSHWGTSTLWVLHCTACSSSFCSYLHYSCNGKYGNNIRTTPSVSLSAQSRTKEHNCWIAGFWCSVSFRLVYHPKTASSCTQNPPKNQGSFFYVL